MTRRRPAMRPALARLALPVLLGAASSGATASLARAQAERRPELYCVRDVRLEARPDAPRRTLVLRDGRIESVLDAAAEAPAGARVVEGRGMLALPAFLDAYTQAGCATPNPVADRDAPPSASAEALVDMRESNRKGIQPAFRAADAFQLDADARKRLRASGFGALLSAPAGQLLSGQSALATTRDGPSRGVLLEPVRFDHAGFRAPGPGYPATPMGATAQIRQFVLDARRHGAIFARRAEGKTGPRLPHDADLEAIRPALEKRRRVVCEADAVAELDRWLSLAEEFDLRIAISGGREAWKRAPVLAERGIPVFLTLDWGEEVEDPSEDAKSKKKKEEGAPPDAPEGGKAPEAPAPAPRGGADEWKYEEPLRVREERRRLWLEGRDCALRLAEAGVEFAFGSGKSAPKELLERVRTLVEAGLPRETALAALTSRSAALLDVGAEYGALEPGRAASLAIWTKDPLTAKDAKVAWLIADGFPYELEVDTEALQGEPGEGVDATGTWSLEFETPAGRTATVELTMEKGGDVRGTFRSKGPDDDPERSGDLEGHVAGAKIRMTGELSGGPATVEIVIEGELDGDSMSGTTLWKTARRESSRKFTATRTPKRAEDGR